MGWGEKEHAALAMAGPNGFLCDLSRWPRICQNAGARIGIVHAFRGVHILYACKQNGSAGACRALP